MTMQSHAGSLGEPDAVDAATRLLRFWFDRCDGYVAVSRIAGGRWLTTAHRAESGALAAAGAEVAGFGAMFPTYVRTSTLARPPARESQRGGKADTLQVPGLFADVDGAWGAHRYDGPLRLPATPTEALAPLEGLPEPSIVVSSGGGLYPLWRLVAPLDRDAGADLQQRWAAMLAARYAEHGLHLDSLGTTDRVLRWPGTYNTKAGDRRLVHVSDAIGVVYGADELGDLAPPLERAPMVPGHGFDRPAGPVGDMHPYDALRALGEQGVQIVVDALVHAGWQVTARQPGLVDLLRPGGSSERSVRIGGEGMTPDAVYVFSAAVPHLEGDKGSTLGALLEAGAFDGDAAACKAWLIAAGIGADTTGKRDPRPYVEAHGGRTTEPSTSTEPSSAGSHLPEWFWHERPELAHVRQAARSRILSPDAVLGCVLARVAAITPHTVALPAITGSVVGLSLIAALVGPSGAGKSSAMRAAAELIPAPSEVLDSLPAGSGEGMVDALYGEVRDPDDEKGKRMMYAQTRYAAIFEVDEGQVLADLGSRSGSTLMTTLRTVFSHGTIGATNASRDRKRRIPGDAYVFGVVVGFQPEHAVAILDDAAGGTPQRFAWFSATDPAPDDSQTWPGRLDWARPLPPAALRDPYSPGRVRHLLAVHPSIYAEVRAKRLADVTGTVEGDPLDAHATVLRLKLAAVLALLAQRWEVTPDDWRLAAELVTVSREVRRAVQHRHMLAMRDREQAAVDRRVRQHLATVESTEARADEQLARTVSLAAARVRRHFDESAHPGEPCRRSCITRAAAQRHRPFVDDALEAAVDQGFLVAIDGGYGPGARDPEYASEGNRR